MGRETHLIAGGAARLQRLRVMAATIHAPIPMEIDEIHEQLTANAARKAARMPAGIGAEARGKDRNVASGNQLVALQEFSIGVDGVGGLELG